MKKKDETEWDQQVNFLVTQEKSWGSGLFCWHNLSDASQICLEKSWWGRTVSGAIPKKISVSVSASGILGVEIALLNHFMDGQ